MRLLPARRRGNPGCFWLRCACCPECVGRLLDAWKLPVASFEVIFPRQLERTQSRETETTQANMPTNRKTSRYLNSLQDRLEDQLPESWCSMRGSDWRILKNHSWGYSGVGPAMTFKGLPTTRVFLTFGVSHTALDPILRTLIEVSGYDYVDTYQVSQDSQNYPLNSDAGSIQVADYNETPPPDIFAQLLTNGGIHKLQSFFDQFSDLKNIRSDLEDPNGILMKLGQDQVIVAIDFVLGDIDHLRQYRESLLAPNRNVIRVDEAIEILGIDL